MITTDIEKQKLHFAKDFDLTHSLQRIAAFDGKKGSIAERADDRFFWNKSLCSAFLEQKFFEWVTPMVQAHIEVTEQLKVKDKSFRILYISRRSCKRQGMRFTMRGVDDDGNVANFVETEQICLFDDGRQTSFVQIRGSIPVFWSSPVTMKYAPKVYQAGDVERDVSAFQKHAYELMSLYGRVLFVNLIDKKKEQLKLGEAMAKTVADAATKDSHILAAVRLVWFDFHRECRNMKWGNLEKLIKQVDDDFLDHGYFCKSADGAVVSKQSGVVRTNCMDNLDRTNVVQSLFGRRSLLLQLNETEALQGNVLNSPFEEFERTFKRVWGNNADAISLFYAGTGALKTDFTRTGKRTKKGALMDGRAGPAARALLGVAQQAVAVPDAGREPRVGAGQAHGPRGRLLPRGDVPQRRPELHVRAAVPLGAADAAHLRGRLQRAGQEGQLAGQEAGAAAEPAPAGRLHDHVEALGRRGSEPDGDCCRRGRLLRAAGDGHSIAGTR
ncbi:hypothetical protein ON010_g17245 [Phytophthora cinnamomi]|nr:hypothetical protein ON010_g17245 [Phytophthora cinnamomi]